MDKFKITTDIVTGAILGAVVIPAILKFINYIIGYIRNSLPKHRILEGISCQTELCRVFVRDLQLGQNSQVLSIDPINNTRGGVPNIRDLWPHVEGIGVSYIFNVLGQVHKTDNIVVVPLSHDHGEWNSHIIVFGAQTNKSFEFYRNMQHVAYRMDNADIYDNESGEIIERENGYGYGIILKSINPFANHELKKGIAILIGGFGVLGTEAAAYYFQKNFRLLGKEFGKKCFGIVVRARASSGAQSVERIRNRCRVFDNS